jgi:hypothetical protein
MLLSLCSPVSGKTLLSRKLSSIVTKRVTKRTAMIKYSREPRSAPPQWKVLKSKARYEGLKFSKGALRATRPNRTGIDFLTT